MKRLILIINNIDGRTGKYTESSVQAFQRKNFNFQIESIYHSNSKNRKKDDSNDV